MGVVSRSTGPYDTPEPIEEKGVAPELVMIGASYKSADIAFRESLARAVSPGHVLRSLASAKEVALLSTCNRFELYLTSTSPEETLAAFYEAVAAKTGAKGVRERFYQARGAGAVNHLFRVASGLESVVVGEPQILSQVRAAGISSRKEGTAGAVLGPLFDRAYRVGTRIRGEFGFEREDASLSDMAVEAAVSLSPKSRIVMLIGTGKMARLAARKLAKPTTRFYVSTRRKVPPRGLQSAVIVPYSGIRKAAKKCDLIISATTVDRPLLMRNDLKGRSRKIVIDLGLPRNVSPDVRSLPNVRLFDLDDIAEIAASREPPVAVKEAELEASREAHDFHDWLVQTRLSSALADLYSWADAVRVEELEHAFSRLDLKSDRDRRVLEAMGRRIVSKILSRPTKFARRKHDTLSEEKKLELLKSVFGAESSDGR